MRWSQTLRVVDVHCGAEIGRVVTGGLLNIPGETASDKLRYSNEVNDSLRGCLCSEPRGGSAGSFILLPPTTHPEADVWFIVLQPDQAHAMSGSNAMCAVTALLETGMLAMHEPETTVTLDTAADLVRAVADCADGQVVRVHLNLPASFVAIPDATIEPERWGKITYDVCFGGVFYALIGLDQVGLKIEPDQVRQLAETGVAFWHLIAPKTKIVHPTTPGIYNLAYVMFRATDPDGVIRTCTTLRPGRVDRSPCGTGSISNMAVQQRLGRVQPGDTRVSRAFIGSEFTTTFPGATQVGPFEAALCKVAGTCWIYAISQIGLDPGDPFKHGFIVSDTWGG